MREIKFRAWHEKLNRMIYDISVQNSISEWVDETGKLWCFEECIMQYTGLHDKNGKDIYFDDFVKAPSGNIFQVIWYDEEMRTALKHKDTIYNFNVGLYEVIGNIYENPELMRLNNG